MILQTGKRLFIHPFQSRSSEIGRWIWVLTDTRNRTLTSLEGITAENQAVIDWQSPTNGNSLGSLLYHIAAIEASWLYEEVLQQDFPPDLERLLPVDVRDNQDHLAIVKGVPLDEHLHRLELIHSELCRVYSEMTLDEFCRPRQLPGYEVTPGWVLHHLIQHEVEHRSQIAELRHHAEISLRVLENPGKRPMELETNHLMRWSYTSWE